MKMLKLVLPIIAVMALVSLNACSDDTTTPTTNTPAEVAKTTYTADAEPILTAKCNLLTCHNSSSTKGKVDTYSNAKAFAAGGRMVGALKHEDGYEAMPAYSPKLSDEDIATIEKWISDGLLEE
jgi:cytochrome c553